MSVGEQWLALGRSSGGGGRELTHLVSTGTGGTEATRVVVTQNKPRLLRALSAFHGRTVESSTLITLEQRPVSTVSPTGKPEPGAEGLPGEISVYQGPGQGRFPGLRGRNDTSPRRVGPKSVRGGADGVGDVDQWSGEVRVKTTSFGLRHPRVRPQTSGSKVPGVSGPDLSVPLRECRPPGGPRNRRSS